VVADTSATHSARLARGAARQRSWSCCCGPPHATGSPGLIFSLQTAQFGTVYRSL
jgi:hypothetical protein